LLQGSHAKITKGGQGGRIEGLIKAMSPTQAEKDNKRGGEIYFARVSTCHFFMHKKIGKS